jgi:A/G-specific adenine glycosylase
VGLRDPIESSAVKARLWEEAERLADGPAPGDLNQALMELGATVCTPRKPDAICPLPRLRGHKTGGSPRPSPLSAAAPRREPRAVAPRPRARSAAPAVARSARRAVGCRTSRAAIRRRWSTTCARTGLESAPGAALGGLRHAFTHRALELDLVALEDRGGRLAATARAEARLCTPGEIADLPLSRLMKKALALARR